MRQLIRSFWLSSAISLLVLGYVLVSLGVGAGFIALVLAAIEFAFSFDNAVINAKILTLMSPLWQRLFLSVGIIIAIFGVRAFLPVIIVGLTAHLPLGVVTDLAFHHPEQYAHELEAARPAITAFGGAFLLLLALHFFISDKKVHWFKTIEQPLSRYEGKGLPLIIAIFVIAGLALLPENKHKLVAFVAGVIGLAAFEAISGLILLMNKLFGNGNGESAHRVGWAAFATFLYLEVLDASLSFDGVIGAFAITNEVVLIAAGLGIGAVWVRSLTVYMVKRRMLEAYKYLEHGAHYAIGVLAVTMLLGVVIEVPDILTGVLCLGLIAAAVITSRQAIEDRRAR